jgi:hypothetical protein
LGEPDNLLAGDRRDPIEVSVVVPDGRACKLGNRRDDQVGYGNPVVQRPRMREESLDVESALYDSDIAGQLVQRIELPRDRIVILRTLRAEQDLKPNRSGGRHEVGLQDPTPLGPNLRMAAPVPGARVG